MLIIIGRWVFGLSIALFGIQDLIYGHFPVGLPPAPQWASFTPFVYFTGLLLIAAGVSIALNWRARQSSAIIGAFFLLCVLAFHLLHPTALLLNGTDRTRALEPLALGAAALAFSGWQVRAGQYIFAFSMIVFGVQHFQYATFLAVLVPSWLPWHLFWILFTGTALIAAGLAIAIGKLSQAAAACLAILFLLWVLTLHGPRVAAQLQNSDEWSSLFVAMAFCGASLLISGQGVVTRVLPVQTPTPVSG